MFASRLEQACKKDNTPSNISDKMAARSETERLTKAVSCSFVSTACDNSLCFTSGPMSPNRAVACARAIARSEQHCIWFCLKDVSAEKCRSGKGKQCRLRQHASLCA